MQDFFLLVIMDFWKKLTSTEKAMIGMILVLLLMVLLNWKKVSKGIEDGYNPIKKETPINKQNE